MASLMVSLTEPPPPGFAYDPRPLSLRMRTFCAFSADRTVADRVVGPVAGDATGMLVQPAARFEFRWLGPLCAAWDIPGLLVPCLAQWAAPFLALLERTRRADDAAAAQTLEAERAIYDRYLLAREHCDFRNNLLREVRERRRMEDALRDADRRKDEFLAMLSHELRNPLAPIRSSLFVLARSSPGSELARRSQAIIGRQVEHLARIVDDLLDVTRITQRKIRLKRERVDMAEVLWRTLEDHRASVAQAGLELQTDIARQDISILGDRTRLAQVIGNLLQNAEKFTPRGGRVTVSLRASESMAVLRVSDTGVGMTREVLERLFTPFAQADRTLARSQGGLGLGLALVKELVELHGGRVSAQSGGPDRGSEICVMLPREPQSLPVHPEPHAPVAAQGRRVLVIEDNADAAESLRDAIVMLGHDAQIALDGSAGLAAARARRPEVIVCDIGLPGMDGYQVAREIRADPELQRVTLIALTGYAQPEDMSRARAAGFDAHLAKPPSLDALGSLLQASPH